MNVRYLITAMFIIVDNEVKENVSKINIIRCTERLYE